MSRNNEMIVPSLITQTFPFKRIDKIELSHSSLSSFRSCPRKFEFRKLYGNSRRQESLASGRGSALHAGIQTWMTTHDWDQAVWEMIKQFPIKYQKSWADNNSLAACYHTLKCMCEWEKLDEFELATLVKPNGEQVVGIEVPFILRIDKFPFYPDGGTITIDYVGYIDFVLYHKMENEYSVCDLKTTTTSTDKTVEYQFSDQCVPYGLILESILGRDISKGFEVDYWVAKSSHEEPKNSWYPFHKTHIDLQDWLQGYLLDLNLIKQYYNMGWFPRRGNSCMTWNRPCANFDFCETRNPQVIEMMLDEDSENQHENDREEPWIVVDLKWQ